MKTKPSSYYKITPTTVRLLTQYAANPGRGLLLSQVRHLGKAVYKHLIEVPPTVDLLASFVNKHDLPSKLWRPEMAFLGFVVGTKPVADGRFLLTYEANGVRITVEHLHSNAKGKDSKNCSEATERCPSSFYD